jgi:thymidylate synthase
MDNYLKLLKHVLDTGEARDDRTGTGTLATFSQSLHFDLQKGFPLLTTKRVYWKAVVHELLWFLRGDVDIKYLKENGVRIWNEWADEDDHVGPVYGHQWRSWENLIFTFGGTDYVRHDQIAEVIKSIKNNPTSRRHVVSAWNVTDLPFMALPPCHMFFQFYVSNDNKLSCQFYMRSSDVFLGLPFNIASYALLTHMIAHVAGLDVGHLHYVGGDVHIYKNHIDQVQEQLSRESRQSPRLNIKNSRNNIDSFVYDDFELVGYDPHPTIKAEVSV